MNTSESTKQESSAEEDDVKYDVMYVAYAYPQLWPKSQPTEKNQKNSVGICSSSCVAGEATGIDEGSRVSTLPSDLVSPR